MKFKGLFFFFFLNYEVPDCNVISRRRLKFCKNHSDVFWLQQWSRKEFRVFADLVLSVFMYILLIIFLEVSLDLLVKRPC